MTPCGRMLDEPRHAVITGGAGCLGQAITAALQDPGWTVVAPGKSELDVRDPTRIGSYFSGLSVDLLVCAAGITLDAPLDRLVEGSWDQTWMVNFRGAASCAKAVLPGMVARGTGHIIFISSFSAFHPPRGQSAYATAKASLLGLVSDLALRHGPSNVRCNAILPGFLETRMTTTVSERRKAQVLADHTLGRFNTCSEVASFIRFLHYGLPHTSGQTFSLDSRLLNR